MKLRIRRAVWGVCLFAVGWGAACDLSVTEKKQRPFDRPLTSAEIVAQLRSANFREKLEARRELGRLDPETRLRVLRRLLADEEVASRLLAVQELTNVPGAEARALLQQTASGDADATVREQAQQALAGPPPADVVPADAPPGAPPPGEPAPPNESPDAP